MRTNGGEQGEKVIDMVAADVVLERGCPLAGERVNAKADWVDEIAVVYDAIAPIGDAPYV